MSIKINKAQSSDVEKLQQICINAYSQNFGHHWLEGGLDLYLNQQFSISQLSQDVNSLNADYYLIYQEASPIGFFKISNYPGEPMADGLNWLELEKLYVLPTQKGQGIGQLAMEFVITLAKQKTKEALTLYVIDTNQAAIRFYEKNGFSFIRKTRLEIPYFKEELKGAWQMARFL